MTEGKAEYIDPFTLIHYPNSGEFDIKVEGRDFARISADSAVKLVNFMVESMKTEQAVEMIEAICRPGLGNDVSLELEASCGKCNMSYEANRLTDVPGAVKKAIECENQFMPTKPFNNGDKVWIRPEHWKDVTLRDYMGNPKWWGKTVSYTVRSVRVIAESGDSESYKHQWKVRIYRKTEGGPMNVGHEMEASVRPHYITTEKPKGYRD